MGQLHYLTQNVVMRYKWMKRGYNYVWHMETSQHILPINSVSSHEGIKTLADVHCCVCYLYRERHIGDQEHCGEALEKKKHQG